MNPTSIIRVFGKSSLGRRFTVVTLMFLSVLLGIMVYTTMTIQKQKSNAILIDMAGRQRMLFEKHLNEVYLTSQGITADYKSTRELLRSTLASLMKGGSVTLDPETGRSQTIPAAPTEEILLKLHEQANHFDKVIESSNGLLMLAPDQPEFHRTLQTLLARNSTVIKIADDAVKQLDRHSELSIATMVKRESITAFFVALLGVFITGQGIRASKKLENEIDERKRAESALLEANQSLALDSELGSIINKNLEFPSLLQACTETLVHRLDAAFVRIWLLNPDTHVLELQASAGLYTHLDGPHSRIPVGHLKIGQIAAEKKPHLTNAVIGDPRIPEQAWAKREGLVAFAGYPLVKNDEVLGVLGLFAKHPLTDVTLESLQIVSDRLAMAIERQLALYEYQKLAKHNEQILASAGEGIYGIDLEGQTTFVNPAGAKLLGYTPQELIGRSTHTIIHHTKTDGSPYPQKECPMYTAFTDGTIHKVEDEVLWRKDGTSFPVEYSSMPIWQDGNLAGAVVTFQDVTERKQAEKILRATEQMYRQILDSIPDMVLVKDRNFRILWANKAFRSYYDMTNEELKGILDSPINVPSFTEEYNKDDSYVFNTGKILDIPEEPVTRHDGQVALFHTIKAPLFGESGEVMKSVGVSRDITERKATEDIIRKGERKFRAIYEQAPTGIATMDSISGRFTQINQKYCDIMGYSPEEMLERNFQELTHPDDLQADLEHMQQLLAGQIGSFQMEKRYIKKNGQVIWVNLTCVPLWLKPTDPRLHIAMVEDITHRKQAEKTLQESEERYRTLYEDNPSMYFTVAQEGKILSVNQFGAQQLGYSVEELIGQPVIEVFLEDDKPLAQEHFNACLQDFKTLYFWELRKQRKDGTVLWVREVARTIQGEDGKPVVLIVCEDITERKQTEERLRQSEAKETDTLRQSDELKSALLSSVSHELRTPLTSMKGSVASIIGKAPSNMAQEQQALLKGIDTEIDYMSQLVNNLLDMSQIEAGTLIPHKEWHLLEDLVEGALRRTEQTLDTRDIEIQIPENIPPIFVDAVKMQQVFINLLDNAVKYSLPASPIRIHVRVEAQQITVEASNMGEPIQTQDLERIFDRFYRRPPPRQQPIHGTGLGLAICKGIIEAHGGRIWADSIEGKVTITFTIPTTEHMASFSLEGRHKSQREL